MQTKKYAPYIIAFCATIVRYYDYALFGLSASVLSKHFMPDADHDDRILQFFAVFSIAVLARPVGSIIFGKIGDKAGRIVSIKISMMIAAISTSLIAFIPDFSVAGWISVILLTLLRMLFLVSLSGEIDAIKIYVSEKIGATNRHLASGIISFSSQIGVIVASIMHHITISRDHIPWLWKLNFIIGGIMGIALLVMRSHLEESELFIKNKKRNKNEMDNSTFRIVKDDKSKFILASVVNGVLGGGYHFLIIFLGTFAANVINILPKEQATLNTTIAIILYGISGLLSGYIADKVAISKQLIISLTISIICISSMVTLLRFNIFSTTIYYLLAFITPFYAIPCTIKMQSLFNTNTRMRMFSFSHSIGSMIFSSTTPFICMLLWKTTETPYVVPLYFLFQLLLLSCSLFFITKKSYINMFES
ncbi:MFS transporter [Rickettsiaceae bacterium]|nr:MFS transporter [Rickettsiaceae bacterium]